MKILRKVLIILIAISIIATIALPYANALDDPEADCKAAIVADVSTGRIIYQKNAYDRLYPASLTKIVTAMVVIDKINDGSIALNDIVTFSEDDFADVGRDTSSYKFLVGEQLTVEDLLYCIVMTSANEPCNALANYVCGSIDSFVGLMNSRVNSIGCTLTHFGNTHGLPHDQNYTTAYDQMLIISDAMEDSLFSKLTMTETHTIPSTAVSEARELENTNNLIRPSSSYYYEYVQGGKTGYTGAAGFCLSSVAQRGELKLACVILGAESVIQDNGRPLIKSFSETRRLYRWTFSNFNYRTIVSTIDLIKEIPVELGEGMGTVILRPEKDITGLLDSDTDIKDVQYNIRVYSEERGEALIAPVNAGDVLGEAQVTLNGVDYGTVRLVANSSVALDKNKYIMSEISNTLQNIYVKIAILLICVIFLGYIAFIIIYNIKRKQKKQHADELAKQRINEIRARERQLNSGKTFEEIERRRAREENIDTRRKK